MRRTISTLLAGAIALGGGVAHAQDEGEEIVEELGELEEVDFAEEEEKSEREKAAMMAAAGSGGTPGGGGGLGIKLFVDLLAIHQVGQKKFDFRPNHTFVFIQANVYDDLQFMIHVSDNPIFFELSWNMTPRLTLTMGKLLVPFGTNEFHHIIGGRVDQLSNFLPETWGDYGLSLTHLLYDGEIFNVEYVAYAVNGFSGVDEPNIAEGSPIDNNFFKALGTRIRFTFWRKIKLTGSVYFDLWDDEQDHTALFYALGLELQPGLIDLPVLRHMRVRGEWARGEVNLPERNFQRGITDYAFARAGYYGELQFALYRNIALRLRVGRINPNNTVSDDGDIEIYEPALLVGLGTKLWWTLAYQFTARTTFDLDPKDPSDVIYGKFFLQY